ncbi:hypothetical protein ACQP25_41965 [Microtetraspora malaysiensis]
MSDPTSLAQAGVIAAFIDRELAEHRADASSRAAGDGQDGEH